MVVTAETPRIHISTTDRFSFTLFLAICFHMLVILGIGFVAPQPPETEHRVLNVVLATSQSKDAPEKADFIGQANQQGGGEKLVQESSSSAISPLPSQIIAPVPTHVEQKDSVEVAEKSLLLSASSVKKIVQAKPEPQEKKQDHLPPTQSTSLRAQAIASLQADLDNARQAESKRKRRRTVSAAIHQTSDALYLNTWQRKIERIGNLNYPAKARLEKIHGSLKMKIGINQDGSLEHVELLASSGFKILDDAAIRIVYLAAPYSPLPPEIRRDTDILEIIRVWQFLPGNRLSTH